MAQTQSERICRWFVSGLKKLPRVVLRKPARRDTADTGGTGDTLLKYQSPILTGHGAPDVLYNQASDMPMEHPAPAPSEAHSHHSNGHSSYRCTFSPRSCSCGSQILRHLHGPPQRRRSHHTSHSVALDHTYDTHPTAHSSHELYDAKAGDTTLEQNPSSSSLHPTTTRWSLRADPHPRCPEFSVYPSPAVPPRCI